ncbi:uncharacterized protein L3040_001761 [Drepanopeziza brunnea f. sp. 'multigermtubi']|uniref:uncharacterized protein n=1 Tax=Drepanopeziza brunnea f. sp. 'multigermtubi' TaxID=698441 RepID=UPI002399BC9B|nr:hypothetical protein L3040_001761 [Drepanopeziza brunnea f. sp. 'multigermtubi']
MTERPLSIATQIATPIPAALSSTASISAGDPRPVGESAEEEPYTIKCICDYSDDDGNTIYCEICDTWQHIECYYPGQVDNASKEEFDHSCADCKPRMGLLDRRHATERQRQQRQNKAVDSPDKKTKRPPSKSHKKKAKPSEVHINNGHQDHDAHKHGSPPPPTKKSKGHRSNQSVSSQIKRSPPITARSHIHAHPPSPVHTPPDLPSKGYDYSERFMRLYDDDKSILITSTNSFASLSVSNSMGLWLNDAAKMYEDTGMKKEDCFDFLKVPVDSLRWPELRIERRQETDRGTTFTRICLINVAHITGTLPVGELNGIVGTQNDYCNDVENRWADMAHPRPFVFFIPHLPLFIDTRSEGSLCRYVRRSCRPNTALEIFIAQRSEYHFWLTTDRPLAANEEITMPWEFKFPSQLSSRFHRLLNLIDEEASKPDGLDATDEEYDVLIPLIHTVLSDHGGEGQDEDDNRAEPNGLLTEHSEREKRKLAALEDSFRKMEQGQPPRKKKRASDGSSMSLPAHAAANQPTAKPRQRSAASRASISQTSGTAANGSRSRQYVDASTASRRESASPSSAGAVSPTAAQRSPDHRPSPHPSLPYRSRNSSTHPKPSYVESSTQTDEVDNAWWNAPTPRVKRKILPLATRLLKNRQNIQRKQEAEALQRQASVVGDESQTGDASPLVPVPADTTSHGGSPTDLPTDTKDRNTSVASSASSLGNPDPVDITMPDAPAVSDSPVDKPLPPTWPDAAGDSHPSPKITLRMPPTPVLSPPILSATVCETPTKTPTSARPPNGATPVFSAAAANGAPPVPIKPERKKLSLSDYAARRAKKTDAIVAAPGSSPTLSPAVLKPSLSTIEEAGAQGGLEGSAMVESPTIVEKSVDLVAAAGATSGSLPINNPPAVTKG